MSPTSSCSFRCVTTKLVGFTTDTIKKDTVVYSVCQKHPGKFMLWYNKPVVGTELSSSVYLSSIYAFRNRDSLGSLDTSEIQLINNMNCFFLREEVAMKLYVCPLNSNTEKRFTCFAVYHTFMPLRFFLCQKLHLLTDPYLYITLLCFYCQTLV